MSKKAAEFQRRIMSSIYRGKGIFKPLGTGWIDGHTAAVREWIANIYFYKKGNQVLMIDAGYNYDRLEEKMGWLGLKPPMIHDILITHQDTDHVGAVERDSPGLFRSARLYIGEIENRYLTGEAKRKVCYHLYALPRVYIDNEKTLLKDGQVFQIGDIRVEAVLCPGHTGWTDDFEFAFRHIDRYCDAWKKTQKPADKAAPYDGYDESDDTEETARSGFLPKAYEVPDPQ